MGLIASIVVAVTLGCSKQDQVRADKENPDKQQDSLVITLVATDSTNALDILRVDHKVAVEASALGPFVSSIDSVAGGDGCFWLFSVNGVMAQEAADRVQVKPSDTVRWHFRRL